jgi:hypothetical protein
MWCIKDFKGFTVGRSYSRYNFNKMKHLDHYEIYHNGSYIDKCIYDNITRANNSMVKKLKNKKIKEKIYIANDLGEIKSLTNKQIIRYFTENKQILESIMIMYNRNKKLERLIKD